MKKIDSFINKKKNATSSFCYVAYPRAMAWHCFQCIVCFLHFFLCVLLYVFGLSLFFLLFEVLEKPDVLIQLLVSFLKFHYDDFTFNTFAVHD